MAEVLISVFKRGDRFSFSYAAGEAATGKAATMRAAVKPYGGGEKLALLDIVESETEGTYFLSTDVDTSAWPAFVMVDVRHTDTGVNDATTMIFQFTEAVTTPADYEA